MYNELHMLLILLDVEALNFEIFKINGVKFIHPLGIFYRKKIIR